jgi:hypothetical protein
VRANAVSHLSSRGYVILAPRELGAAVQLDIHDLDELRSAWDALPPDEYLRDGGHYRSRRHACFVQDPSSGNLIAVPHRAHWQPTSYNALHGGMQRWFEPIASEIVTSSVWRSLLGSLGSLFAQVRAVERWHIEAHQFRIDTAGGIGRPTPEGAHRDGVDFVALLLVQRRSVKGGETRVFDANGPAGVRFTMETPWCALLMDDARVIHETTPIQPDGGDGVRDTLVLTYRAEGFQSPDGA